MYLMIAALSCVTCSSCKVITLDIRHWQADSEIPNTDTAQQCLHRYPSSSVLARHLIPSSLSTPLWTDPKLPDLHPPDRSTPSHVHNRGHSYHLNPRTLQHPSRPAFSPMCSPDASNPPISQSGHSTPPLTKKWSLYMKANGGRDSMSGMTAGYPIWSYQWRKQWCWGTKRWRQRPAVRVGGLCECVDLLQLLSAKVRVIDRYLPYPVSLYHPPSSSSLITFSDLSFTSPSVQEFA